MSKPRSDSVLFKLSPEQQEQLYNSIYTVGYRQAQENLAQAPPAGFGLKVHLNSLVRFVHRYSERERERHFFDILRSSKGEIDPNVLLAAETRAHRMAFDIATSPHCLKSFRELSRWVMTVKNDQLRDRWREIFARSLDLSQRRAELAAASRGKSPSLSSFAESIVTGSGSNISCNEIPSL